MNQQSYLDQSAQAIGIYNPRAGSYLCVVGNGSEQRLVAVQKNWFGRLLMWLGCGGACMAKVARYVADNIKALRPLVPEKKLTELTNRIEMYDLQHPKKIWGLLAKIEQALSAQPFPILNVDIFQPTIAKMAKQELSSTPDQPPEPVALTLPPPLIEPQPIATPAPPITPQPIAVPVPPIALNIPQKPLKGALDFQSAKSCDRHVMELLRAYVHDEDEFKDILNAMDIQDIITFSQCEEDCFGLSQGIQDPVMIMIFKHMPIDKLHSLVHSALDNQWIGFKDEFVYHIGSGIIKYRPSEADRLFNYLAENTKFDARMIKSWSADFDSLMEKTHAHLSERAFNKLIKFSLPHALPDALRDFVDKIHDPAGKNQSLLNQKTIIQPLSLPVKKIIANRLIETSGVSWIDMDWIGDLMHQPLEGLELLCNHAADNNKTAKLLALCKDKAALLAMSNTLRARTNYSQQLLDQILLRALDL